MNKPLRFPGLLFLVPLLGVPGGSGLLAQDAVRPRDAAIRPRVQDANTELLRARMQATAIRVPPDSARVVRPVVREGVNLLEVPIVTIVTGTEALALKLSVDPNPGLTCNRRGCAGVVRVGVVDTLRPLERIPLPSEMQVEMYGPDSVAPSTVVFTATRTLSPVRVQSRTQEATLMIQPIGLPTVDVELPVRALKLSMTIASQTIDAWGLEKTQVHIAPVQGLDADDTVEVRLQGAGLRIDPSLVKVTAFSGATAEVRSRSVDTATVSAFGPAYVQPAREPVRAVMPWSFILFTLVGGLIGAFFRERFFGAGGTARSAVTRVLASALMGALLAVGTAVGINLTTLPLPTGIASEALGMVEAGILAAIAVGLMSAHNKPPVPRDTGTPRPDHQPA